MSIDIGTGAGRALLRRARQDPAELVIGLDADPRAMADASRRASASTRRGGLPNALFLAAAAEDLPGPLTAAADLVTIALPWGSLLSGLLVADGCLITNIAALLKANGEVEILISATDRDAAAAKLTLKNAADADELADRFASAGLQVVECRPAVESDVDRLSSGWGRRLGIPEQREAWLFRARLGARRRANFPTSLKGIAPGGPERGSCGVDVPTDGKSAGQLA